MIKSYDWLVVGGGITGAALGYELAVAGFSVLLIEEHRYSQGASRFSYGGIPYWSGTTELTTQLAQESMARYPQLAQELELDIEFRDIDLLLTIPEAENPQLIQAKYNQFATPPQLLDAHAACNLEPMINPDAISGAIYFNHAHVNPQLLVDAYQSGIIRHGGEICVEQVIELHSEGVKTLKSAYRSKNIVVCAGGAGRALLQKSGIAIKLYFTHAEVIETAPTEFSLRSLVMPASTSRLDLESESGIDAEAWNIPNRELLPPSIDVGAIQFKNRQLRLGQISFAHTNPDFSRNLDQSENEIRAEIQKILPAIALIPGTCHHCLVAFSQDSLPLIGLVAENIHIFSGFTSPFLFVPILAQRFAKSIGAGFDPIISSLSPHRFKENEFNKS